MDNNTPKVSGQNVNFILLLIIVVVTIILWQFHEGRYILYPFTILGTWFHEMGHGLTAIALGGRFVQLAIYPDGSGIAFHTGSQFLGGIGNAVIAAGGPIGPTIAGGLFIAMSGKAGSSRLALFLLAFILIASDILWIRYIFGFTIILLFGIAALVVALRGNNEIRKFSLQFLAVQALLSVYLSIGYLFSAKGKVCGKIYISDTGIISENLFLPYWFWGTLILVFSAFTILISLRYLKTGRI